MIAREHDQPHAPPAGLGPQPEAPGGLPAAATIRRLTLTPSRPFDLLVIPVADEGLAPHQAALADVAHRWVTANDASVPAASGSLASMSVPAAVVIPLYGCHVIWAPNRGAVLGSPARSEQLAATLGEFAAREAELGDLERRGSLLLATVEADAPAAFEFDDRSQLLRPQLAARFLEAVAVRRGLAALGPAVHVPPVHPPTLASQLAERLRDRTRLAERHELATDRADFAFQVYEACGQRAAESGIARRQMGLEWAIIVILLAQVALMLVEMLTSGTST